MVAMLRIVRGAGSSMILNVLMTPDGKSYVYSYGQMLSDLFLVEGLK